MDPRPPPCPLPSCGAPPRAHARAHPRRRPRGSSPTRASREPGWTASRGGRGSTSGCSITTSATRRVSSGRSSPARCASARAWAATAPDDAAESLAFWFDTACRDRDWVRLMEWEALGRADGGHERRRGAAGCLPGGRAAGARASGARPPAGRRGPGASSPRHGRAHHVPRGLPAVHPAPHRAPPDRSRVRHPARRVSPAASPTASVPCGSVTSPRLVDDPARLLALALSVAALASPACSRGEGDRLAAKSALAPAVAVTAATRGGPRRARGDPGHRQRPGLATVSVYSLLSGQIFQVHFKEGHDVKAGALLFTIDPRPFESALQQAQATMAQHQAAVAPGRSQPGARPGPGRQRPRRGGALQEARAGRPDRARAVRPDLTAHKSAVATVDADRAAVTNAKALVQADAAAVENAKVQLSYTEIRAPIDGRTGNLLIHQGNVVKANDVGNPLVVINRVHPDLRGLLGAGSAARADQARPRARRPRRWRPGRRAAERRRARYAHAS